MKVYISGPITNIENGNKPAFAAAADLLRALGHEPINPHDLHDGREDLSHAEYMRRDIAVLVTCDAICMLRGWGDSKGASGEHTVAGLCAMPVLRVWELEQAA